MQFRKSLIPILAVALSFCCAGLFAQSSAADAEAERRALQQNAITDRYLTTVQVEMEAGVDTKSAAAGQAISAKLLQAATLADGTGLAAGTRLLGHVVQAKPGGTEQGSAILVLTFDHAEVTGGKSVPVRCVIRAVTGNRIPSGGQAGASPQTSEASSGAKRRGGVAGGMPGTVPSISSVGVGRGGPGSGPDLPPMGDPDPISGPGAGSAGSGNPTGSGSGPVIGRRGPAIDPLEVSGPTANMKVEEAGDSLRATAKSTGLPGVLLIAAPTASGMLTAAGRNFSLEPGTQITLGVIGR